MAGLLDILFKDESNPKNVAKAYADLSKTLKRDEGAAEDRAWREKFDSLASRDFSPGTAFTGGNAEEADPDGKGGFLPGLQAEGTGVGSGYQEPSELERWKSQIDGLITSGNPVLQKQGLDMISQFQQRATSPESKTDTRANTVKEYQFAKQDGYEGSYTDFLDMKKNRMFQNKLTSVPDSKSLRVKPGMEDAFYEATGRRDVGPGMDMQKISPFVMSVDPEKVGKAESAGVIGAEINDAFFGKDGILVGRPDNPGLVGNLIQGAKDTWDYFDQSDPRVRAFQQARKSYVTPLARSLGESGNMSNIDISRAEAIVPNLLLPNPDSPGTIKLKLKYMIRVQNANNPVERNRIITDGLASGDLKLPTNHKQEAGANKLPNKNMPEGAVGVAE